MAPAAPLLDGSASAGGTIGAGEAASLLEAFSGRPGVVLAVSGGADSMAMMALAARWGAGGAVPLTVATVDHGLRAEAAAECRHVAAMASRLGLACRVLKVPRGRILRNIQERARDARYALLEDFAVSVGADAIATAHTLDDQAETVLMRLAHGSSIDGLAAMRPLSRRGQVDHLRPLLSVPRSRLEAVLAAEGVAFVVDPSNEDLRYERPRLRRVRPVLEEAGLTAGRLAQLAERAARMVEALEAGAAALLRRAARRVDGTLRLDGAAYFPAERELRIRVLAHAVAEIVPGARIRLERLEDLERDLSEAARRGAPLRRTLAGAIATLMPDRTVTIIQEGTRRRGNRTV